MIVTKKALPRRTLLRGMGATVALPLLDAMVPSMTALAATPANPVRRLGYVYMPMGAHIPDWTPAGEGALKELRGKISRKRRKDKRISGLERPSPDRPPASG